VEKHERKLQSAISLAACGHRSVETAWERAFRKKPQKEKGFDEKTRKPHPTITSQKKRIAYKKKTDIPVTKNRNREMPSQGKVDFNEKTT